MNKKGSISKLKVSNPFGNNEVKVPPPQVLQISDTKRNQKGLQKKLSKQNNVRTKRLNRTTSK